MLRRGLELEKPATQQPSERLAITGRDRFYESRFSPYELFDDAIALSLLFRPLTDALGFLPHSNSPHHDAEPERRPLIHRLIGDGTLPDGYATDNGGGLVYHGLDLHEAITENPKCIGIRGSARGRHCARNGAPYPKPPKTEWPVVTAAGHSSQVPR